MRKPTQRFCHRCYRWYTPSREQRAHGGWVELRHRCLKNLIESRR